jgi:universal stress protein E
MRRIRRIFVAVKNTRQKSFPALAKAAVLARALDARLDLFHGISEPVAFETFVGDGLAKFQEAERARHRKRLEAMAEPLRRSGIDVSTAVEWDYPSHEALVRRAQRTRADLIIAGRHTSQHAAPWLLRYTDWELLRQSPVPVLLVKKPRPYRAPAILAAVDPAHSFSKTAQLDRSILEIGARIGEATRGALHVMHAYVPDIIGMDETELISPNASQLIADKAAALASKRLDSTLRTSGLSALKASRRHLVPLHPVDSIPRMAQRLKCDIVVMGALSRTGLKRLLIGNTAERLLDDLACDLLVVKPPGFKTGVGKSIRGPELYFPNPPSGML